MSYSSNQIKGSNVLSREGFRRHVGFRRWHLSNQNYSIYHLESNFRICKASIWRVVPEKSGSATRVTSGLQNPIRSGVQFSSQQTAGFGNPYLVRVAEPDPQCRAIQQRTDGLGSATRISLGLLNPVRRHSRHQRANGWVGFCNSNHNSVAEPDSSVSRGGFRFRRRIGLSNNTVWIGIGC